MYYRRALRARGYRRILWIQIKLYSQVWQIFETKNYRCCRYFYLGSDLNTLPSFFGTAHHRHFARGKLCKVGNKHIDDIDPVLRMQHVHLFSLLSFLCRCISY